MKREGPVDVNKIAVNLERPITQEDGTVPDEQSDLEM